MLNFFLAALLGAASFQGKAEVGIASYYGDKFIGRRTANGERYSHDKMTAAHKKLPFGTQVEVKNLATGRSVVVTVNDRGPFIKGRIVDLSKGAARGLGMIGSGLAKVSLRIRQRP